MSKTLTEQWREGTLPEGYYYTKGAFDDDIYISHFDYEIEEDKLLPVEEVLAPVPSYEEYNELLRHSELSRNLVYEVLVNQKEYNALLDKAKENKRLKERLEIATKALKEYNTFCRHPAEEALKEMEGVK